MDTFSVVIAIVAVIGLITAIVAIILVFTVGSAGAQGPRGATGPTGATGSSTGTGGVGFFEIIDLPSTTEYTLLVPGLPSIAFYFTNTSDTSELIVGFGATIIVGQTFSLTNLGVIAIEKLFVTQGLTITGFPKSLSRGQTITVKVTSLNHGVVV